MNAPGFETVRVERDGAVTWLRLNRPERLNALTEESCREFGEALAMVRDDAETRVLILTGSGRGFCAGSDVAGLEERLGWSAPRQMKRFERLGREMVLRLYDLPIPTVAAVNGPASGGGLSLALACDIRVAADAATFVCGFTAVGLVPDLGATYFLPRVIGMSRACRLLWTNARLTAAEAAAMGLVDEVIPAGEFQARVAELAASIAAAPPLAVRLGRAAMRAARHGSLAEALDAEGSAQSACLQSADHRDRVRAYLRQSGAAKRGSAAGVEGKGVER